MAKTFYNLLHWSHDCHMISYYFFIRFFKLLYMYQIFCQTFLRLSYIHNCIYSKLYNQYWKSERFLLMLTSGSSVNPMIILYKDLVIIHICYNDGFYREANQGHHAGNWWLWKSFYSIAGPCLVCPFYLI